MAFIDKTQSLHFDKVELERTLKNLLKQAPNIEFASRLALLKSGKKIKKIATLLAPKDTGNLRASAFIVYGGGRGRGSIPQIIAENNFDTTSTPEGVVVAAEHIPTINSFMIKGKTSPYATIGFTAFYALKEHENTQEKHLQGESKFLEKSLKINERFVLKTLKESIAKGLKKRNSKYRNSFFDHFTK